MDRFQISQFPDSEGLLVSWPVLHGDSTIFSSHIDNDELNTTPSFPSLATADEIFEPLSAGPKCLASNAQFSKDSYFYNQETIVDSPPAWGNTSTSLESQASPSTLFGEAAHPPTISTTTNDTVDFSPNLLSPRYVQEHLFGGYVPYMTDNRVMREPKPRQSTFISDVAATFRHHRSAGVFERPSEPLSLGIDNNGRDHPLYQNVAPHDDGLYHCPWEGQEECKHQPAKLKCEYE